MKLKDYPVKKILLPFLALYLAYALAGFFLVPDYIRKALETAANQAPIDSFSAESIQFNPLTLSIRVQELSLKTGEGGPSITIETAKVNLSLASLFRFAPVVSALDISSPRLSLATDGEDRLILPEAFTKTDPAKPVSSNIVAFSLSNVRIDRGRVIFVDGRRGLTHRAEDIRLSISEISTLRGKAPPVTVEAGFVLDGTRMDVAAEVTDFTGPKPGVTLHTRGSALPVETWLPYVPLPRGLSLSSPGTLTWDLELGYAPAKKTDPSGSQNDRIGIKGEIRAENLAADLAGQGPLVRLPEVFIGIDSPDLLGKGLKLDRVVLKQPELFSMREASGRLPLVALWEEPEAAAPKDLAGTRQDNQSEDEKENQSEDRRKEKNAAFPVALARAEIGSGKIHLRDDRVPGGFETLLSPVSLNLEDLELAGDRISLAGNAGVTIPAKEILAGSGRLEKAGESLGAEEGHFSRENTTFQAYAACVAFLKGEDAGFDTLTAAAEFSLARDREGLHGWVKEGAVELSGLRLGSDKKKAEVVRIPRVSLQGIEADLDRRALGIGSVKADEGRIGLGIDREGRLNLMQLDALFGKGGLPPSGTASPPFSSKSPPKVSPGGSPEVSLPWQFALGKMNLENWHLALRDDSRRGGPVDLVLSDIGLHAESLSTESGEGPGRVRGTLTFQESGQVRLDGTLDLAAARSRMAVTLDRIPIKAFQPYFTDYLNVEITEGSFRAGGQLDVLFPKGKHPRVRLTGKAGISDFSSKDKETGNDFFRAKSFFVSGMDISLWPARVEIKEVSLTDFYTRAILSESGRLNYRGVLVRQEAGEKEKKSADPRTEAEKQITPVSVEKITLQGGHINFTDLFTHPNYTTNMTRIAGSISNLSSTDPEPADVILKGLHGQYSPLDITGKIRPLGKDRMADIHLSFKNIDLIQFNAYAGKYLGYEIETGKLILNLEYAIRGNKLESSNRLFFDQFNLGERVESKDATSLPIELAVSLLKNSKDQIDLDIPVRGNLDDPDFNYGKVVFKAFSNLILSVVAAPFKLLGRVFSGWDSVELGFVTFDPGQDTLDKEGRDKLEKLGDILSEKPKLKFIIEGRYDPDLDGLALRKEKYMTLLRAETGEKSKAGVSAFLAVPENRLAMARKIYIRSDFPKPRDEKGKEKKISPLEMEKLVLTHLPVTEADLSALADRRSNRIMDYLASREKIDPDRLFVKNPGPVRAKEKAGQTVKTVFRLE